jgi:diketogulonate reductase-like aldo/keto reductase
MNQPCSSPRRGGLDRREALRLISASGVVALAGRLDAAKEAGPVLTKSIPSSGEAIPVVGLGSWRTFNVGDDPAARGECGEVMRRFFAHGGRLIDSSPMYGSSQEVIGEGLTQLGRPPQLFSAEKVWTSAAAGPAQIEATRRLWGVDRFDLLQVHNLQDWERHLQYLFERKAAGRLRYVGVTTSHGRRTAETERIVATQPIDFVQVTYNVRERELESRLLPLAAERGVAVLANRPFAEGALIDELERHPLPSFAGEIDCANWPQLLLKFVVSHPAVTCAIPATSQPAHLDENMGAARGRLPDEAMRRRIVAYVESL